MTISLRNTPALAGPTSVNGTASTTANYNGTTPVLNDLIVCVLTLSASTSTALGTTPTGWTLTSINETNSAGTEARVVVYTRTANGTSADNAPVFANTTSGTAARDAQTVVAYIFDDSSGNAPVLATSGVAQGTTSSPIAPVTAATVPRTGCYAVAAMAAQYTSSGAITWTTPSSGGTWTTRGDSSGTVYYRYAHWSLAAPTSGSTVTCSMAWTGSTTYQAAMVLVVSPGPVLGNAALPLTAALTATEQLAAVGNASLPVTATLTATATVPLPFTPAGSAYLTTSATGVASTTMALVNQYIGDLILVFVRSTTTTAVPSGISGGGATWVQLGSTFTGTTNAESQAVFAGTVTATGSQTATISLTGGTANIRADGQEFTSITGTWSLDVQGNLDSAGTSTWPSLTPAAAGELYAGMVQNATTAVPGSTPGYTYDVDVNSNGFAYNGNCTASAQAPVWGDSGQTFGTVVLLSTAAGGNAYTADSALPLTTSLTAAEQLAAVGDASLAVTAGFTAAEQLAAAGNATLPLTAGLSAAAGRAATGSSSLAVTAAFAATGQRAASAASAIPLTAALTATGQNAATGNAALPVTVTLAATATVSSAGTWTADSVLPVTTALVATGLRAATDGSALPVTAGFAATGLRATTATAMLPVTAGLTAGAVTATTAGAVLALTAAFTATGTLSGAFTVGALTAADTPGSTITAAGASNVLTASTATGSTLTAGDQRTGGPS